MISTSLPICFFPTTVVFVDDDKGYLNGLLLKFKKQGIVCKSFFDPKEALSYLEKTAVRPPFLKHCIQQEVDPNRGERGIKISIWPIRDVMLNPKRFEQLSVLVIDQQMPGLKGLEICEMLKDTPIRKILLTGEVDDKAAIKAFNEGRIDKFLSKNTPDFYLTLNNMIVEQQAVFFENVSAPVKNALVHLREGYGVSHLLDPIYIKFVNEIIEKNNICEYYIADDEGDYIFLNAAGHLSWLVLKDEGQMIADYDIIAYTDDREPKEILEGLKERKIIISFIAKEHVPPEDWQERGMVHPAQKLEGAARTYYYAYIENPNPEDTRRSQIMSFEDFKAFSP